MSTPDPKADTPATDDAARAPRNPAPIDDAKVATGSAQAAIDDVAHTRTRATFVGWIIGAIITILLLIFILRNLETQKIDLVFWTVDLPVGVSLLIAAIAGALITALIGGARTFQLSRALKKARKAGAA